MNEETANTPPCGKYRINIEKEDLINLYVRKWVLRWCKENRPEVFKDGRKFVEDLLNEEKGIALNEKR